MLIVTGAIVAKPEGLSALIEAARLHVHRSRTEPGCISHHFHADLDDPHRMFFYERWESLAALRTHVDQPGTKALMTAVREHAATIDPLEVYDSMAIRP